MLHGEKTEYDGDDDDDDPDSVKETIVILLLRTFYFSLDLAW